MIKCNVENVVLEGNVLNEKAAKGEVLEVAALKEQIAKEWSREEESEIQRRNENPYHSIVNSSFGF